MFRKLKTKSVLYRLLLSYVLIFVIPLGVLTTVLYKTTVINLQREIENSNMVKLTQLKDTMDMRMKELEFLALRINIDSSLTPLMMSMNEYKQIEGIKQLGYYRSNNAFIYDLLIYYKNLDSVFSAAGQTSLRTFLKYSYPLSETSQNQLADLITSLKSPKIRAADQIKLNNSSESRELITYLYPIYFNNDESNVVVMFYIQKSVFEAMVKDMLGDFQGSVLIFNNDNDILAASENKSFSTSPEILDVLRQDKTYGVHNISINGSDLSLIKVKSEYNRWNFAAVIPSSQFFQKAINMREMIIQVVLVILLFGMFLILLLAFGNYKPIQNVLELIGARLPQAAKMDDMDEIGRISHTITNAMDQNEALHEQMNNHRPLIRDQILARLLRGEIKDDQTVLNLLNYSQINLSGPYYTTMLISDSSERNDSLSSEHRNTIIMAIEQNFSSQGTAYPVELTNSNNLALLVNLKEGETSDECMIDIAGKIKETLENQAGGNIIISIGKPYDSITALNRSFIEALAALESNILKSGEKLILFRNIMGGQRQIYWFPLEDQLRFVQSLKQGDKQIANDAIKTMISSIKEKDAPALMIKYVCYDIVNLVIKSLNDLGINAFDSSIKKLMEFSSLDDLENKLIDITNEFCGHIEDRRKHKDMELLNRILAYIHLHFDDCNISLDNISSDFNLPVYYLSRFIKEHTTFTFTEYITNLRIEKAKKLLTSTDGSLKKITADIGYTDQTIFMRNFKKLEGITPGRFRELHSITK